MSVAGRDAGLPSAMRAPARVSEVGTQWIVEAFGCDAASLRDRDALDALFGEMVRDLGLHPVRPAVWHAFDGEGGLTGFVLLAESHIACHTFPEHESLCLDLFCCRPRVRWDFERGLAAAVGATRVVVRHVERAYALPALPAAAG